MNALTEYAPAFAANKRLRGAEDERRRHANAVCCEACRRSEAVLDHRHLDHNVVRDLRELLAVAVDVVRGDREHRREHRATRQPTELGEELVILIRRILFGDQRRISGDSVDDPDLGCPSNFIEARRIEQISSCAAQVEVARIANDFEKERVRWCRSRRSPIVLGLEQQREIGCGSSASRDLDHRAHEEAYHVVQEAIGLDLEYEPVRPLAPRCIDAPCSDGRHSRAPYPARQRRENGACRRACAHSARARRARAVPRAPTPTGAGRVISPPDRCRRGSCTAVPWRCTVRERHRSSRLRWRPTGPPAVPRSMPAATRPLPT